MKVSGQLHAPATLPQGKGPWYQFDRSHSGHGDYEKNLLPLLGITPQSSPQSVTILTELSCQNPGNFTIRIFFWISSGQEVEKTTKSSVTVTNTSFGLK
jgi:hypothetical protein